jgi:hypothetical protein
MTAKVRIACNLLLHLQQKVGRSGAQIYQFLMVISVPPSAGWRAETSRFVAYGRVPRPNPGGSSEAAVKPDGGRPQPPVHAGDSYGDC